MLEHMKIVFRWHDFSKITTSSYHIMDLAMSEELSDVVYDGISGHINHIGLVDFTVRRQLDDINGA